MTQRGDTWCKRGLASPWCRTILTRVVGVMHAVWPLSPAWHKGELLAHCGGGQLRRCYLRWGAGMFSKTTSKMWGSCNLTLFLLRDRSMILIYLASLMVLVMSCTSLPSMEKWSKLMQCLEMLPWSEMGEGTIRCSFILSLKVCADSPMYSSSESTWSHLYLYITHFLWENLLSVLGGHQEVSW